MKIICPICLIEHEKSTGHFNRAIKLGLNVYCGRVCAGIGRRDKKSIEEKKLAKSEYDRLFRLKNKERDKPKKAAYHKKVYAENPEKFKQIRKAKQQWQNEYCRRKDQREKERLRNRAKNGLNQTKDCLICNENKQFVDFESYAIFQDGRHYMCKSCELKDIKELNIHTREVLQTLRSNLVKTKSNLKIRDMAKYPYLIEANKYLLLLKRQTK